MSAFVTPDNQKVIWNIIQTNPIINTYFNDNQTVSKERWFRSIIEKFYIQHQDKQLTSTQLHELNKSVLSFMIQSIYQVTPQPQQPQQPQQTVHVNQITTPPIPENNRERQYMAEYEKKREEYEQMNKRDTPKPINFQEKQDDQPLQDMDSLIKQHIEDREKAVNSIIPPIIEPNNIASHTDRTSTPIIQVDTTPRANTQSINIDIDKKLLEYDEKFTKLTTLIEELQAEITMLKQQKIDPKETIDSSNNIDLLLVSDPKDNNKSSNETI